MSVDTHIPTENGMQKRRHASATTPVLPVTGNDADRIKKHRKRGRSAIFGVARLLAGILAVGMCVVMVQKQMIRSRQGNSGGAAAQRADMEIVQYVSEVEDGEGLPLSEFPSLQYALKSSDLVALYFAASWCKMSTSVTNKLDELFRDALKKPPESNQEDPITRSGITLIYVSSDQTMEEMQEYMRPNWMAIPFDSEERSELKRHFKTCAKRELEELKMERLREIPSLIVISGRTHQVLSYTGIDEVNEMGINAPDHWIKLDRLTGGLQDKYAK